MIAVTADSARMNEPEIRNAGEAFEQQECLEPPRSIALNDDREAAHLKAPPAMDPAEEEAGAVR